MAVGGAGRRTERGSGMIWHAVIKVNGNSVTFQPDAAPRSSSVSGKTNKKVTARVCPRVEKGVNATGSKVNELDSFIHSIKNQKPLIFYEAVIPTVTVFLKSRYFFCRY